MAAHGLLPFRFSLIKNLKGRSEPWVWSFLMFLSFLSSVLVLYLLWQNAKGKKRKGQILLEGKFDNKRKDYDPRFRLYRGKEWFLFY